MTHGLSVIDISSYLEATGWIRQQDEWRGAAIWVLQGDHEILVPGTDDLRDGPRRVREIVALLARLEERSREEVASDIRTPMADVQWYRAPIVPLNGQVSLLDAVTALTNAKSALDAAARAVVNGPRQTFDGAAPKQVRALLASIEVGPIVPSGNRLTVRVPLERDTAHDMPLARRTLVLLQGASERLSAVGTEVSRTGEISAFDGVVEHGVSAELCEALARFAGADPGGRFEIGFRWARALPTDLPPRTVTFEAGMGPLLRRAAHRLRRRQHKNTTVIGQIVALADSGFRVQVRGTHSAGDSRSEGVIWVRLSDQAAYDRAVEAHLRKASVRARGDLVEVQRRRELNATSFSEEN